MLDAMSTTIRPRSGTSILGILLLFVLGTAFPLLCVELDIKGFLDTYHAVRAKAPQDFLSSRTRLRLEALSTMADGKASAFVSFNLQYNNVLTGHSGLELREAYLEYVSDTWDLRAGRQIIVWGKADGIQVTDQVCPMDLTEFLARDFDDIRIPVEALKFRLLGETSNFELVWVPFFSPAQLPGQDNPWALPGSWADTGLSPDLQVVILDPQEPERKLGNSEIFTRLSFFLPGVDLALSGFYTWDDYGVANRETRFQGNFEILEFSSRYYRVGGFGADFSMPAGQFVVRGESAFYLGKTFEVLPGVESSVKKNALDCLLGLDWYAGKGWTLSGQLVDQIILDHEDSIREYAHNWLLTLNVSKNLMRETLVLSNMLYLGFNDLDIFNRFMVDYTLADGLHLMAGFDLFAGEAGYFGYYKDNTEFFIKAKYSF